MTGILQTGHTAVCMIPSHRTQFSVLVSGESRSSSPYSLLEQCTVVAGRWTVALANPTHLAVHLPMPDVRLGRSVCMDNPFN